MIHIFIGTKAQLIKMAPIMLELRNRGVNYNFISSGQHKETINDLLNIFGLPGPDVVLYSGPDVTTIAQAIKWSTKILFNGMPESELWKGSKSGVVINHGDTFSTILGTMLAKKNGLLSAHIESGLRSFNYLHPFPEELTRVATFRLSDMFFCPGEWALRNVKKYKGTKINTRQNSLIDSLKVALKNIDKIEKTHPDYPYAVVSIHRFENIFQRKVLRKIVEHLNFISSKIKLVFIAHIPTLQQLKKHGLLSKIKQKNITLRERMDYFEFIKLVYFSEFVVSDGGSNQEECAYLGKPCLLMRKKTERQEGIKSNIVISKLDRNIIENFVENLNKLKREPPIKADPSPSKIIVDHLLKYN